MSFLRACATTTDASIVELERLARSFRVILPAVEKFLSYSAEYEGITSVCHFIKNQVTAWGLHTENIDTGPDPVKIADLVTCDPVPSLQWSKA